MYVSVSAYNDAGVLEGCLASIREVLPGAEIVVMDGKYETWPEGEDNSTDETPEVCQEYDAGYVPAGPFEREVDKHKTRVYFSPDGVRTLLMDADERLIEFREEDLPEDRGVQPRIFNPVVYSTTPIAYWPRVFYPEQVQDIARWDAYTFESPPKKTDAVTIYHRHDLRDLSYRQEKYERFRNEGRVGRYEKAWGDGEEIGMEAYLNNEFDVEISGTCPECGGRTVVESPATCYGTEEGEWSKVRACLSDNCWSEVVWTVIEEPRYVPDRVPEGIRDDPERVRRELVDAGCGLLREVGPEYVVEQAPIVMAWVRLHRDELEAPA